MMRLDVKNLSKWYGPRKVFENINFSLEPGQSMAVVGPNGSGKSTLLKLLIGFALPSRGQVTFSDDGKKLEFDAYRRRLGLVSPYLALYGPLTARENLRFLAQINGDTRIDADIEGVLERVGLGGRGDDFVAAYSSGMQQRLKYAVALLKKPLIWMLDEPGSNLDEAGKKIVAGIIDSVRKDAIIIIATNEREEYSLAERLCQLGG